MEVAALVIAVIFGVVGAVGAFFGYKSWRNSRQPYLDSLPCKLSPVAKIVSVDESPIGGVSLQVEIRNNGLGRAFNVACEAHSTFLWDFDYQRTTRNAQTLNLMRRDSRWARSRDSYPPFGFDERLDMPPSLRDVHMKYLEPNQSLLIADSLLTN
jgi:hypothetical protein